MQYNNSIYEPKYRTAFFQKGEVKEQLIKAKMKRPDEFNPKNVENYVNPQLSLEERLKEKLKSGKKLNSSEKIQYEFIQKKNKEALELDLNRIEILKENSSGELPETEEGKVLLLFQHLNKFIESNNDTLVCQIFLKIQNAKPIHIEEGTNHTLFFTSVRCKGLSRGSSRRIGHWRQA
jgi:hypothetical protein